jgi:hypothetical protein
MIKHGPASAVRWMAALAAGLLVLSVAFTF